jgi:hypothetical protein
MENFISTLEVVKDYFTFRLNEASSLNNLKIDYFQSPIDQKLNYKQIVLFTIKKLAFEAELKNKECFDYYINYTLEKMNKNSTSNKTRIGEFSILINKLQDITQLLFNDKIVDWARIIALISFVSYLSYKFAWILMNKNIEATSACACTLIEWLTSYLTCKCGMWIECNGGWESFENYIDNN